MGREGFSTADYTARLAGLSPSLPRDLREAAPLVAPHLSEDDLRHWAEEGVALAAQSLRSWEAASEYFRASPRVAPILSFDDLLAWARFGRDIADQSSIVAAAYFRAGPDSLSFLSPDQLKKWAATGQRLYQGNWKSISLASLFFAASPALLPLIGPEAVCRVGVLVERLAEHSYELAGSCLEITPAIFGMIEVDDRLLVLNLADSIVFVDWTDLRLYFENVPQLIRGIDASQRGRFLKLSSEIAKRLGSRAYALFAESAMALSQVDTASHRNLISLAEELAVGSPAAAMEFLKSAPEVLSRISLRDLSRWQAAGHRILRESSEGGEAFFRLQSGKGEQMLEELSPRVELSRVAEVLRLYCKALTGANVSIHPSSTLTEKGIGWVATERPSTEGTAVYLPEVAEEFADKEKNFSVYKVYSTHQAAHLEFGSFLFGFGSRGEVFSSRRRRRKSRRPRGKKGAPLTDMERFFDLFEDRQLIADLFTVSEDARVDFLVKREYPGIRRGWRLIQGRELERRPQLSGLPLREAFLENLIRASLDGFYAIVWPEELREVLLEALRTLRLLQQPEATVEDSAEAALRLYDLAITLPNLVPEELEGLDWQPLGEELFDMMRLKPKGGDVGTGQRLPKASEDSYESPQPVDFRGDFKPELVQLLMRLRLQEGAEVPEGLAPLTAEQLRELMEKSVEITVGALAEGDLSSAVGLFLTNLEKEGIPIPDQYVDVQDGQVVDEVEFDRKTAGAETKEFWYDEWDFRASDYKPRWCRVLQRPLDEGDEGFFEETLRRYSALASQTQKQFEQLRPELFRKIKRLHDGEDFDLDLVIEYLTEKRAGHAFTDKVYWRRNKVERQVAVAFLLDMSASTDEEIEKRKQKYADEDFGDDARRYYEWLSKRKAEGILRPPKRIIDLEKESMVLLIGALEAIGDDYGIYGFSGYGRDNVEFYVLKDLSEPLSNVVKARIDKTEPIRSTRMGPAIRHTTAKLEAHDAKVRILFLVSDGRPQDHGYGRDRTEREYAINDTHQALMEAKRKGIVPFCLTVDREGHEYLGQMCEDIGYEILGDIESLPSRLPTLYRRLTE
jgi:nitric oxide reductase NorD protein